LAPAAQRLDANRTLAALGEVRHDWIVVDHYGLDAEWERQVRSTGARLLAIDDLANRPHACDLLLDQTLGRSAYDYGPLLPTGCRTLLGTAFALLRPDFARARPAALSRRRTAGDVRRILISLGASDVGGWTAPAVDAALRLSEEAAVDAVIGGAARSRPALEALARREPRLELHVDAPNMVELTAAADLAIGAAGTTAWERCCLGLPSLTLVLAHNQRLVARELEAAGATAVVADPRALAAPLSALIESREAREEMTAAAAAIVDGLGGERVANVIFPEKSVARTPTIAVRPATKEDAEAAWLWRNDPATRRASQSQAPVRWADHEPWWRRACASNSKRLFIAEVEEAAAAVLRFDRLSDGEGGWEVSINLRPDARGGGLGAMLLGAACEEIGKSEGDVRLEAVIHRDNIASQRVFARLGFRRSGRVGKTGFDRYARPAPRSRTAVKN
jgi:UDP-2,4-diacetamido-2,4,6-trideoxy-beta-L-altropyranose hydrolase